MISSGNLTLVSTGRSKTKLTARLTLSCLFAISISSTPTNSWESESVSPLHPLPTDVTSLCLKLLVCATVVPPLDLPELERPRPLRILVVPSVSGSWCSTAPLNSSSEVWPRFSRDYVPPECGDASMNSTEFLFPPFPSSLPRSNPSPSVRNSSRRCSSSLTTVWLSSSLTSLTSSP